MLHELKQKRKDMQEHLNWLLSNYARNQMLRNGIRTRRRILRTEKIKVEGGNFRVREAGYEIDLQNFSQTETISDELGISRC